jgi:Holliday junction resolvasome RuvABC ATP-dependent DNA helicase subunit
MMHIKISGPQGIGKTTLARLIEMALFMQHKTVAIADEGEDITLIKGRKPNLDCLIEVTNA